MGTLPGDPSTVLSGERAVPILQSRERLRKGQLPPKSHSREVAMLGFKPRFVRNLQPRTDSKFLKIAQQTGPACLEHCSKKILKMHSCSQREIGDQLPMSTMGAGWKSGNVCVIYSPALHHHTLNSTLFSVTRELFAFPMKYELPDKKRFFEALSYAQNSGYGYTTM